MNEAAIGLAGVLLGAFIALAKDIWSEWLARKQRARYLAMHAVCILDEYANRCTRVAMDDGQRNEDGNLETTMDLPSPPRYPLDVDWNSIDHELMYRLPSYPSRAEAANRIVESAYVNAFPPDYEVVYEARHYQYAKLGLDAIVLAQEIRQTYGIPDDEFADWNPIEYLENVKARVEQIRRTRMESINELLTLTEDANSHAES